MERSVILAYLAGVLDSDGYVKISVQKALRMRLTGYAAIIGVSQLWPSEAINLFEETFGGKKYLPMRKPGSRAMARWEVRDCISEIALSELVPFGLVKDEQAKLLLKFIGLKTKIRETVLRLNSGMSPLLETLVRNRFAAEFVPDLDATRRKNDSPQRRIRYSRANPRGSEGILAQQDRTLDKGTNFFLPRWGYGQYRKFQDRKESSPGDDQSILQGVRSGRPSHSVTSNRAVRKDIRRQCCRCHLASTGVLDADEGHLHGLTGSLPRCRSGCWPRPRSSPWLPPSFRKSL